MRDRGFIQDERGRWHEPMTDERKAQIAALRE
jgi:hypothetical protein